jgi:hypothetical protein
MRRHVHAPAGGDLDRAQQVEEAPGPDHAPRALGQKAADREAAELGGARGEVLHGALRRL